MAEEGGGEDAMPAGVGTAGPSRVGAVAEHVHLQVQVVDVAMLRWTGLPKSARNWGE